MVFAVKSSIKSDNSVLKKLKESLDYFSKNVARVGVLNADEQTLRKAIINHEGGKDVYDRGPFKGEAVDVPPRPFVEAPAKNKGLDILTNALKEFYKNIDLSTAVSVLDEAGNDLALEQEKALDTNGEGIAGWQKWQDYRTIITKGHNKPLHTWCMATFPIDYEITRRSA